MLQYTYGKPREYYEQIVNEFQSSKLYSPNFKGPYSDEETRMLDNYVCAVLRLEEMEEENASCN